MIIYFAFYFIKAIEIGLWQANQETNLSQVNKPLKFDYLQDLQSYIFPQKGKDFSIEK